MKMRDPSRGKGLGGRFNGEEKTFGKEESPI